MVINDAFISLFELEQYIYYRSTYLEITQSEIILTYHTFIHSLPPRFSCQWDLFVWKTFFLICSNFLIPVHRNSLLTVFLIGTCSVPLRLATNLDQSLQTKAQGLCSSVGLTVDSSVIRIVTSYWWPCKMPMYIYASFIVFLFCFVCFSGLYYYSQHMSHSAIDTFKSATSMKS